MKKSRYVLPVPEMQPDATLSQANPISGDKYTVLDTTKNVRIISIMLKVTWTVQPTPLEVHITIDGQALTGSQANPVSVTNYYVQLHGGQATLFLNTTDQVIYRTFLLEGRSVKIEVETTGGTVSNLSSRVKYAKW